MIGICKLCIKNDTLRNSHIIAETFYDGVYDRLNRFIPLTDEPNDRHVIHQNGFKEYLLCSECEQKFGRWENSVKNDLLEIEAEQSNRLQMVRNNNSILVRGINYSSLKYAILSTLWRMSISSLEFFRCYELGNHTELIRNILKTDSLPTEDHYPILISKTVLENNELSKINAGFNEPKTYKDISFFSFLIYGFLFDVFLTDSNNNPFINEWMLKENGDINIPVIPLSDLNILPIIYEKMDSNRFKIFHGLT